MYDVIKNKVILYNIINQFNKAEHSFDYILFNHAHEKHGDSIVKGLFHVWNLRKEAEKEKKAELAKPKKEKENAFAVGEDDEEVEFEEGFYYHEEMAAYFKKVSRDPGTKAKRFRPQRSETPKRVRFQDRSRNRDNRGPRRSSDRRRGQSGGRFRSRNDIRFRTNWPNNRRNLRNSGQNKMVRDRSRLNNFRAKLEKAKESCPGYLLNDEKRKWCLNAVSTDLDYFLTSLF